MSQPPGATPHWQPAMVTSRWAGRRGASVPQGTTSVHMYTYVLYISYARRRHAPLLALFEQSQLGAPPRVRCRRAIAGPHCVPLMGPSRRWAGVPLRSLGEHGIEPRLALLVFPPIKCCAAGGPREKTGGCGGGARRAVAGDGRAVVQVRKTDVYVNEKWKTHVAA